MRTLSLPRTCAIAAACLAGPAIHAADLPVLWRHPLPGIVRSDQGTIEITVRSDRPQREFGNDWHFAVQIMPDRSLGRGANSLLGVFIPPAPESGLVALLRTGKHTVRVEAPAFTFTAGQPVNLAVTWGSRLGLWADGRLLGEAPLPETPAEELWPALFEIARYAPFDPSGLRISSLERTAETLDRDPATPFAADPDTTLVAGPGLAATTLSTSRWQHSSGYAMAKPAWLPEEQCLAPGQAACFPVVVANHATAPRIAELALTLTPLGGMPALELHRTLAIPASTAARLERVPLPELVSDYWQVAWSVAGDGLPALAGTSAIAVYPRTAGCADGALAAFTGVHRPERWPTAPFTRMGARATRAWALSTVFLWHRIEPTPGRFRWEEADAYVDSCLADGMEPLAVLGYPSRWAAVEPDPAHQKRHELAPRPERWKPADLAAWARYAGAVAARYRGRLQRFEIYNEVNFCPPVVPATFSGGTADYLALQEAAYAAIRQANPEALVSSSGFSCSAWPDLPRDALRGGLARWCDAFAYHGYSGTAGASAWVAEWRRQRPGAPVWQTEQMWHEVADDRRRRWLTAALPLQFAADGCERSYTMGVHQLLFDRTTLSPTRDQWVAAVVADQLRGCESFSALAEGAGAAALDLRHRFRRSDGAWLTVVGAERGAMRVTLSAPPRSARDLHGRPLRWSIHGTGAQLEVPDLAYLVSDAPLAVTAAEALGDLPLVFNGGFEEVDGDLAMGGRASGRPRGFILRDRAYDPEGRIGMADEARSGRHAVELESSGTGRVYLFQEVRPPGAGRHELVGWFRRGRGMAEPYLFAVDPATGAVKEARLPVGGSGFQQLRLAVDLPALTGKPLAIGWGIRGAGSATIDDVGFAPVAERFDHARFRTVDLGPVANLPRAGWERILPGLGADLAALAPGETVLGGRSWTIGDGERALVAVGAGGPGGSLPQQAAIAAEGTAAALCFLHAALWVQAEPGTVLGRYLVTYADGTTVAIPLENRRTIADWYPSAPAAPDALRIATTDRIGRDLTWMRWVNPHPGKVLRSVAVEGTLRAALLVVAVSAERP